MEFKYYDIKEIQNYFEINNISAQKKFGQNFLMSQKAAQKIIDECYIDENDLVFEIGCGLGNLTNKIIEKKCQLIGFEIDWAFIKFLKENFVEHKNFKLIEGDFLKKADDIFDLIDKILFKKTIILGNLPYYITKEIFEKVFTSKIEFDIVCFMIQKEVTEKILAKEKSDKYSFLSILSQTNMNPRVVTTISQDSFYPSPNITSDVILFEKKVNFNIVDRSLYFKLGKSLFINRRKKIYNNLMFSPYLSDLEKNNMAEVLSNQKIPDNARGEEISIEDLVKISNNLSELKNK
jgi:16S rRNA (adenine1518-N6/adenine1519-N6)-dimethyltransferase